MLAAEFLKKLLARTCDPQSAEIGASSYPVPNISGRIRVHRRKADRILADPSAHCRVVPAGSVVLQAGITVVFAAGVEVADHRRVARDHLPVRVMRLVLAQPAVVLDQVAHRSQIVDQWPLHSINARSRNRHILLSEDLIDAVGAELTRLNRDRGRTTSIGKLDGRNGARLVPAYIW